MLIAMVLHYGILSGNSGYWPLLVLWPPLSVLLEENSLAIDNTLI